jgi:hypothetical protein
MGAKKIPAEVVREIIRLDAEMAGTQAEIGARFGITRQSVCKILHRHNQRVGEEIIKRHAEIKGRQIGRLEHLAIQAMAGWEASKKPTRRIKRRTTESKSGGEETLEKTVTRGPGDPRFLAEARSALADARRVAGLDYDDAPDDDAAAGSPLVTEALTMIAAMHEQKLREQTPGAGADGD